MSRAQGERKSDKKRTDKERVHRGRANAVEDNRAPIAWRSDHACHVTELSGKIPLNEPDRESAGIQARAGLYISKRLSKLGIPPPASRSAILKRHAERTLGCGSSKLDGAWIPGLKALLRTSKLQRIQKKVGL